MGVSRRLLQLTWKEIGLRPTRVPSDRKVLEHLCQCPVDPFSHSFRVGESWSYVPLCPSDPEGLIRPGIDEVYDDAALLVLDNLRPGSVLWLCLMIERCAMAGWD